MKSGEDKTDASNPKGFQYEQEGNMQHDDPKDLMN